MAKTSTSGSGKTASSRAAKPASAKDTAKAASKAALIQLPGLAATIDDARLAAEATDTGPTDPVRFSDLLQRLTAVHGSFPPVYEQHFVSPFIATLQGLGDDEAAALACMPAPRVPMPAASVASGGT